MAKAKQTKKGNFRNMRFISYPVGDFLIRIKNAALAGRKNVRVPSTKMLKALAKTLEKAGYLEDLEEKEGNLEVRIKYFKKNPAFLNMKLVSKPGLRIYMSVDELEKRKNPSFLILSTPEGVLTSKDAIKKRVGGEVIVEIF